MEFDLVIQNGTLIDGSGKPRYKGSIGIRDGRITAIARDSRIAAIARDGELAAEQVIDASGLVVAPGFIDIHSHSDWILPQANHAQILAPLLLQGITTVVGGQCGFSPAPLVDHNEKAMDGISDMLRDGQFPYRWESFGEFLDALEHDGILMNAAFLVGHGSLRAQVMGDKPAIPTPQELKHMADLVRQSIREGAFGLSAGLAYAPGVFAKNEELLSLLEVARDENALFTVHGRAYTWVSPFYQPMIIGTPHNIRSVRELIGLARQAKVRLQLSHQIFVGRRTWRTYRTILGEIEQAAQDGMDIAFDAFPYTVGNSTIKVVFPEWFLDGFQKNVNDPAALRRVKREITILQKTLGIRYSDLRLMSTGETSLVELEGLDFETIGQRLHMHPFEAYMHIARCSQGQANLLLGTYSGDEQREEPLQAALAHPLCAFMTDTILTSQGTQNPASFGTFPRILGRYSRDLGLFSLEEAIRRMTSYSAERTGLKEVGLIEEGYWADLVLFDPQTVADNTTSTQTEAPPSGIHSVLVSGKVAARDGKITDARLHGRVMRR